MGSLDRKFHCCRCKKWHPWSDLSKTEEFGARRRRCVHCDKRAKEKKAEREREKIDDQARRPVMSEENAARFVTLAQIGISQGLWHPIEWFVNWMRLLPGLTPPEKLDEKTKLAEDVFIEFFRNTGENPGDRIESLDRDGLYRMVNDFADEKGLP